MNLLFALAVSVTVCQAPLARNEIKTSPDFASRRRVCRQIADEAVRQGVDPYLAVWVGYYESRFSRMASSASGAKGPMQVIPKYWCDVPKRVRLKTPKLRRCNLIRAGVKALKHYLGEVGGDAAKAVSRYNGSSRTTHYGRKVAEQYNKYKRPLPRRTGKRHK